MVSPPYPPTPRICYHRCRKSSTNITTSSAVVIIVGHLPISPFQQKPFVSKAFFAWIWDLPYRRRWRIFWRRPINPPPPQFRCRCRHQFSTNIPTASVVIVVVIISSPHIPFSTEILRLGFDRNTPLPLNNAPQQFHLGHIC